MLMSDCCRAWQCFGVWLDAVAITFKPTRFDHPSPSSLPPFTFHLHRPPSPSSIPLLHQSFIIILQAAHHRHHHQGDPISRGPLTSIPSCVALRSRATSHITPSDMKASLKLRTLSSECCLACVSCDGGWQGVHYLEPLARCRTHSIITSST